MTSLCGLISLCQILISLFSSLGLLLWFLHEFGCSELAGCVFGCVSGRKSWKVVRACVFTCHMTLRQAGPLLGRRLYLCRPGFWHASFSQLCLMTTVTFRPSITDLVGIRSFACCIVTANQSFKWDNDGSIFTLWINTFYLIVINVILVGKKQTQTQLQYRKDLIRGFSEPFPNFVYHKPLYMEDPGST